eukprot:g3656.t1
MYSWIYEDIFSIFCGGGSIMTPKNLQVALGVALVAILTAWIWNPHWIKAQIRCWAMQIRYSIGNRYSRWGWEWFSTQYQIWCILCIESAHIYDVALNGLPRKLSSAGLRHVDTASSVGNLWQSALRLFGCSKRENASSMGSDGPIMKDLVLVGGGHTHAFVLKMWGMKSMPGVRITLITPTVDTPYSGMLPGHVAGHYTHDECHIDLQKLAAFARAQVVFAHAVGIDRKNKRVILSGKHPPVYYDVLSINVGSTPQPVSVESKILPLTPVKPIAGFARRWSEIVARVMNSKEAIHIVTVGGGAGGVELTLSMQQRLSDEAKKSGGDASRVRFTIVSRSSTLCPQHSRGVQETMLRICKSRNVTVKLNCTARDVRDGCLRCADGTEMKCNEVIWCTSAVGAAWFQNAQNLDLDAKGFISVHPTLQSTNDANIFAAGDCSSMAKHPRPKAGVFAVRAGPPLNRNLRGALSARPLEEWIPQTTFLGIIGTGDPAVCIASSGTMVLEGSWLWDLKDWIDRKWMAGYTHMLPKIALEMQRKMEENAVVPAVANHANADALNVLKHATMRCGGCGAKVGATVLSRVMKRLKPRVVSRSEVLVGLDAPDDAAVVRALPPDMAAVHTVDFFRSFGVDPYVFGRIAAVHALSDCHAMGARPITALAIAVVPFAVESAVEETLFQMMAGAVEALREVNCALIGGHTCEGNELSLGFAVNGAVEKSRVLQKGGMKPGEKLVLTKAIGTGTLFAAHMRVQAEGRWIASALESMSLSNFKAAECLRKHGATACTDITGFGVLGHLNEMVKASAVGATLDLDDLPLLDGALECVTEKQIFSTLQPANFRLRHAVENLKHAAASPRYPLLFDPQTSGGLLASVPASSADACVRALREMGYDRTCVVGEVRAGAGVRCVSRDIPRA